MASKKASQQKVSDIMRRDPFSLKLGTTVDEAVKLMRQGGKTPKVSGAIVTTADGHFVGYFAGDEIMHIIGNRNGTLDGVDTAKSEIIDDFLIGRSVSVGPRDDITYAANKMVSTKCHHMAVVEDGMIKGVISQGDVMDWLVRYYVENSPNP